MNFRPLLLSTAVTLLASFAAAGETVILFDGKNLDQWEDGKGGAPGAGWVIEADGSLFRKEKSGDLLTKKSFANFVMEWEWKIAEGGNSGVKYWVIRLRSRIWVLNTNSSMTNATRMRRTGLNVKRVRFMMCKVPLRTSR
jgi:hypothetical protein